MENYKSMKEEFATARNNLGKTMVSSKFPTPKNPVDKKEMEDARQKFSQITTTTSSLFFELLKKHNTKTIIGKKLALGVDNLPTLNRTALQSYYEEEIKRVTPVFSNPQVLNSDSEI